MQTQKESLIDFSEALDIVLTKTKKSGKYEIVSLFEASGRILAEDIYCKKQLPAFSNSAMDGYAVKLADAGKVALISGAIMAGDDPSSIRFNEGECVKIMTGAPIPPSAEAVVAFENAQTMESGDVLLPSVIKNMANIREEGEESKLGDKLLEFGEALTPAAIGSLASQGIFAVKVAARPKVAVISSGNEIAEPWESSSKTQIYNSNAATLLSLCKNYGCEASYVRLLADGYEETLSLINSLKGYDLLITTGGISMGEADFIGKAFLESGLDALFKKVALKPGKPTMFGYLGETAVLALPGNPISAIANFYLFGSAIIARLTDAKAVHMGYVMGVNKTAFDIKDSRANLILGSYSNGVFEAYNGGNYGSGMIKPIVACNSFIMTGKGVTRLEAGEGVKVVLLDAPLLRVKSDFISVK